MEEGKLLKRVALWGAVALFSLVVIVSLVPFTIIDTGERGVVTRFGNIDRTLAEGIHWRTPFVDDVHKIDVKTRKIEGEQDSASSDLQSVKTTIALNYNVKSDAVSPLWLEVGEDYIFVIVDPAIRDAVKAATALYTAEELITKRSAVSDKITSILVEKLSKYFSVSGVSIVNFSFSEGFDVAVEAKVKAEQSALEAKNKLEQVRFEAQQTIEIAKAEAESVKLQAQALSQNNQYIELKRLEVERLWAEKWNGAYPQNIYAGAPIPLLQIGEKK